MKKIKKDEFSFIETNREETITKAQNAGLEITDIIPDPNNYEEKTDDEIKTLIDSDGDTSKIRPERIAKIKGDIQSKKNQDEINETVNKPHILAEVKKLPHNFKTEDEINAMTWEELSEYHSQVIDLPHRIKEAKDLGIENAENKVRKPLLDEIEEKRVLKSLNREKVNI